MADPASPYNLANSQRNCCCGPIYGIYVAQPPYQTIPDNRIVNNPAYVVEQGKSFWTYKFIINFDRTTRTISSFDIPICANIKSDYLTVSEKIDGCGDFAEVPFYLSRFQIPSNIQWVKIAPKDQYNNCVTFEYRLEITGDYPTSNQAIIVKTNYSTVTFNCECFQVPDCPNHGKLQVKKACDKIIADNQANLNYLVDVYNSGNTPLINVQYLDNVVLPLNLTPGQITVIPHTLHINTSKPGIVNISGNLGTINPGDKTLVKYAINVVSFTDPGTFIVNNTATASAKGTSSSSSCSSRLEIVELNASNCCNVTKNKIIFRITLTNSDGSPDTEVDITDQLFIPEGLTVNFNNFGGCTAFMTDENAPAQLNTNITGPITLTLQYNGVRIVQDGDSHKKISLTIISCTNFGKISIRNTLQRVALSDPHRQLFICATPLPLKTDINVDLSLQCH